MVTQAFPFDAGSGANVIEDQWRLMAKHWLQTGVLIGLMNELRPYGDGAARVVKVKTGGAWIQGHYYDSDAEQSIAIAANATGLTRYDRVALRADFVANTVTLVPITGTTSPPALVQSSSTYEMPIAQVKVANGATVINAADVTDERRESSARRSNNTSRMYLANNFN